MAEQVDAKDLKSFDHYDRVGSIPTQSTSSYSLEKTITSDSGKTREVYNL